MHILELEYPGTFLDNLSDQTNKDIYLLIQQLESSFNEAIIALNLYECQRVIDREGGYAEKYFHAVTAESKKLSYELNQSQLYDHQYHEEVSHKARRRVWHSGLPPMSLKHAEIFLYAKMFLFSLDGIYKLITTLSTYQYRIGKVSECPTIKKFPSEFDLVIFENKVYFRSNKTGQLENLELNKSIKKLNPEQLRKYLSRNQNSTQILEEHGIKNILPNQVLLAQEELYKKFPDLISLRDTIHHIEDRVRGLTKDGEQLANDGFLGINNLHNDTYKSTMANGLYGGLQISITTLEVFRDYIQKIINSFKWHGFKKKYPS